MGGVRSLSGESVLIRWKSDYQIFLGDQTSDHPTFAECEVGAAEFAASGRRLRSIVHVHKPKLETPTCSLLRAYSREAWSYNCCTTAVLCDLDQNFFCPSLWNHVRMY